jgi:hypothetical protein
MEILTTKRSPAPALEPVAPPSPRGAKKPMAVLPEKKPEKMLSQQPAIPKSSGILKEAYPTATPGGSSSSTSAGTSAKPPLSPNIIKEEMR